MADKARKIIQATEDLGGMTEAVISGAPKLWIEESAAKRQARIDSGEEVIVGVNRYSVPSESMPEVFEVNNHQVRDTQIASLSKLRQTRDSAATQRALEALEHGARGNANLLALSVEAMRTRATLGEVSDTLEKVFGRYEAAAQVASGVYAKAMGHRSEVQAFLKQVDAFARKEGRRPRILIAKLGQDGHDRGAKVVATAFADFGFDVDLSPLFLTPEEVAKNAIEDDVHAIGISTLAGAHKTLVPELIDSLKHRGSGDILVFVGGVIPEQDYAFLKQKGVAGIFGPGTPLLESAREVLGLLTKTLPLVEIEARR
jgi:methylmalonyl-CoA mutase